MHVDMSRETLLSWQQGCATERRGLRSPFQTGSLALLGISVLLLIGLAQAPVKESVRWGVPIATFVAAFVGLIVSSGRVARRPLNCSTCGTKMAHAIVDIPPEEVTGLRGAMSESRRFPDGRTGWKAKASTGTIELRWEFPRELWMVCVQCERAFVRLSEKHGHLTDVDQWEGATERPGWRRAGS